MTDPVRDYLKGRDCPTEIVEGGLDGLVARWRDIVGEVEEGYGLGLDDYLNDMDLRDILDGALAAAGTEKRRAALREVVPLDDRFVAATTPSRPLWGDEVTREAGYTPQEQWWFFRKPVTPGDVLAEELESEGL